MDRIRENESENTAVRALVVEVTYKVSLSNAKIPKEVYEELTRMIKNTETLPEPDSLQCTSWQQGRTCLPAYFRYRNINGYRSGRMGIRPEKICTQ
ncbi:MAG: hypothetical protein ACLT68_09770 [Phocaeicola coprophilus]|uniref:hypothetical protein n=1 Tax=Phocaeicola coprophilus TaxID=387090 RepID=UPI003994F6F6